MRCVFESKYPGENAEKHFPLCEEIRERIMEEPAYWCDPVHSAYKGKSFANYYNVANKIDKDKQITIHLIYLSNDPSFVATIEEDLQDFDIEYIPFVAKFVFRSLLATQSIDTFKFINFG